MWKCFEIKPQPYFTFRFHKIIALIWNNPRLLWIWFFTISNQERFADQKKCQQSIQLSFHMLLQKKIRSFMYYRLCMFTIQISSNLLVIALSHSHCGAHIFNAWIIEWRKKKQFNTFIIRENLFCIERAGDRVRCWLVAFSSRKKIVICRFGVYVIITTTASTMILLQWNQMYIAMCEYTQFVSLWTIYFLFTLIHIHAAFCAYWNSVMQHSKLELWICGHTQCLK